MLQSIPSLMDARERGQIPAGDDALGLVFPVYHKGLPLILRRFVETLEGLAGRYIFGVCTYGDSPGLAARELGRLIQSQGGQLAAGFGVQMPYNYLTPTFTLRDFLGSFALREVPLEKQHALIAQAEESVERIAAFVAARRPGRFDVMSDPLTRLADALKLPETLGKSVWLKAAGAMSRPR